MPAGVNYATWESAVHGFGSADALRRLRRKRQVRSSAHKPAGPKLRPPQGGAFDARIGAYVVPFPGKSTCLASSASRKVIVQGSSEGKWHQRRSWFHKFALDGMHLVVPRSAGPLNM